VAKRLINNPISLFLFLLKVEAVSGNMTQEWIIKTLTSLGFSQQEIEVYLLLRLGPKKAKEIADELKIYKRKIYRILKKLQEIKIVQAQTTQPTQFQVIPLDDFLDMLIKNRVSEANYLEAEKPKIFADWKSIIERTDSNYTSIEGSSN
jgi:sugar-specific transcriptional regulator TrmB